MGDSLASSRQVLICARAALKDVRMRIEACNCCMANLRS